MKEIQLSRGYVSQVDDQDYDAVVAAGPWHVHVRVGGTAFYATHRMRGSNYSILLHRFILGVTDPRIQVDHANRNGLDNQRANLRPATPSQNAANSAKRRGNSTSKFKGVHWCKPGPLGKRGKWLALILVNGKRHYLGRFTTEEAAHDAYVTAAQKHFGQYARARKY